MIPFDCKVANLEIYNSPTLWLVKNAAKNEVETFPTAFDVEKNSKKIGSCPPSYGERINQKMFETPVPKNHKDHKNACLLPRVLKRFQFWLSQI